MIKRLSIVLLVLAMATMIFTGCGSSGGGGGDTSLEGTWKLTKITQNYTDDDPIWLEYPFDVFGVKMYAYIQLKDNKYTMYEKAIFPEEEIIDISDEGTYEVKDNKLIVKIEENYYEYNFNISGKKIMVVCNDEAYEAIKVSDSEVAGAQ